MRLRTDYIDLYQLHWPNRNTYHFRQSWNYDPTQQDMAQTERHMLEMLKAAAKLIKEGKIRHFGLSNETVWGTAKFLHLAEINKLPRVVSVQNEYSLLHRLFDLDFAELSHNESVGLLAFSPLAAGLLSGKYADGDIPENSRMSMQPDLSGRSNDRSQPVINHYLEIAKRHELNPAQMALRYALDRPFTTSVIIGATTTEHLDLNLGSAQLTLSEQVKNEIAAVHKEHPIPM